MSTMLVPRMLRGIRYSPGFNVWYVNNPKVACSVVKRYLWMLEDKRAGTETFVGNPHDPKSDPFLDVEELLSSGGIDREATGFSMVRNPYARALSAYLAKIVDSGDKHVRRVFNQRFGLVPGQRISFVQFLRLLTFDAPECLDGHFAPQVVNLAFPYLRLDRLYRLEDPSPLWEWLGSFGGEGLPTGAMNAREAGSKLDQFYDEEAIALVRAIYADDFTAFGYSTDITRAKDVLPLPSHIPSGRASRAGIVRAFARAPRGVEVISRDDALQILSILSEDLDGRVPTDWFDYLSLRLLGIGDSSARATVERLVQKRQDNWMLLADLERICRRSKLPKLAATIAMRRTAVMDLHRAAVRGLDYQPANGVLAEGPPGMNAA